MFSDWKVLHIHPRAEKRVAEECEAIGLEYYLPLRRTIRVYQRRKVEFYLPLFPGYIFVNLNPDKKNNLLKFGHIVRILPVKRPISLLRQLVMVRKAIADNPEISAVTPVKTGEIVKVSSGPLLGCEGYVTKIKRKSQRIVLNICVEMIGQALPIEIDLAFVERQYDPKTKSYKRVRD